MARHMIGAFQATRTRAVQADRVSLPDEARSRPARAWHEGRYQAKGEPRVGGEARFSQTPEHGIRDEHLRRIFGSLVLAGHILGASLRNHSVAVNQVIEAIASDVDRADL